MPNGGLIADVTWGRGVFWKKIQNGQPNIFNGATYTIIGSDIEQRADVRADFRCLPYRDEMFDAVVLDPPWANLSTGARTHRMTDLYQLKPTCLEELNNLYFEGIREAKRILRLSGILIVKVQDNVSSGKKLWITDSVYHVGVSLGFHPMDRMIQVAATEPLMPWQVKQQRHFRARESFYWVMRKQ